MAFLSLADQSVGRPRFYHLLDDWCGRDVVACILLCRSICPGAYCRWYRSYSTHYSRLPHCKHVGLDGMDRLHTGRSHRDCGHVPVHGRRISLDVPGSYSLFAMHSVGLCIPMKQPSAALLRNTEKLIYAHYRTVVVYEYQRGVCRLILYLRPSNIVEQNMLGLSWHY
jgi:hypothetical protein